MREKRSIPNGLAFGWLSVANTGDSITNAHPEAFARRNDKPSCAAAVIKKPERKP